MKYTMEESACCEGVDNGKGSIGEYKIVWVE